MPRKVHVINPEMQNNKSLRTAVTVTLIAGLTLILLSTAVFSLAATTRSLSSDAERLHNADEALRSATTVRAQLALGLHGARVDSRIGSDSSASVGASMNEAELALDGFIQSIAILDIDALEEPADSFSASADASVESIRAPTSEAERNRIDEALDVSFSSLIDGLTSERGRLLTAVGDADRRMGTLGNLASFVVAFLLPTSAIFIYRQLARRPRRQVELEHELQLHRRTERERAEALRVGLDYFNKKVEAGDASAVMAEAERMSIINALNYGQHTYDVARVRLVDVLTTTRDSVDSELTFELSARDFSVLVDERALQVAIGTLIDNARSRGASRLHLTGRDAPAAGKIEFLSDAENIAPLVARSAFLESTDLTGVTTQEQRELVLARTLLEGMGARVEYHSSDEYEKFEITVPRAARSAVPDRAPAEVS